ncbi:MAG: nitrogenase component 1 [Lachnospiraceae bacterium]|nr:nitrogenase component 1 [Lachnospiraceae bacterium]
MSLCRFYPQPSDRMAIMWSLIPIKGAIVLEYGPAGTTHFGGGMYGSLGLRPNESLFTTHISEDDVVMGDVSRLENAILELDAAYAPQVIFVVASAVIAVIGTDIVGVCNYMQEKVNARLVAFPDGGFRGDYTFGLRAVYRLLAEEMTTPVMRQEVEPSSAVSKDRSAKPEFKQQTKGNTEAAAAISCTYQILGASAGSYRIRSDVWEVRQLMQEAFGWDCRMIMGLETSVEELSGAGKASLNLVLRNEALEAARVFQKKFDTPYVYSAPYGYAGTLRWLNQISEVIGVPVNPAVTERLQEKILDMRPMGMGGPMGSIRRKNPAAVIQGDYDTVLGLAGAMEEMEIPVVHRICSHSLKAIEKAPMGTERRTAAGIRTGVVEDESDSLHYYPVEKERLDLFGGLRDTWILGSEEAERFASKDNYFTCVSAPFVGHTQIASHLPFMGEKGMDYLRECKSSYFARCGI